MYMTLKENYHIYKGRLIRRIKEALRLEPKLYEVFYRNTKENEVCTIGAFTGVKSKIIEDSLQVISDIEEIPFDQIEILDIRRL